MFSQTRGTAHPAGRNLLRDGGKLQRSITKHLPQNLIMARAGIIRLLGSCSAFLLELWGENDGSIMEIPGNLPAQPS